MLVYAQNPVSYVEERFMTRQVKSDDETVCALVKVIGKLSVSFLSSCVPNLHTAIFSALARVLQSREIDARRAHFVVVEFLTDEPPQDRCLSCA